MSRKHPEVDKYFAGAKRWREELFALREVLLDCGLTEAYKWRAPCYTMDGKNVAMLGDLKDCCSLSFFKGALLDDPKGVLEKPGENTRAARVIRFTDADRIAKLVPVLTKLVRQAMELEKSGAKVDHSAEPERELPVELQDALDESAELQAAYQSLTPGRQRGYVMFIAGAKQSKTRTARIEKYRQQILDGFGMNDCTCGLSKRMPGCDGSHKSVR